MLYSRRVFAITALSAPLVAQDTAKPAPLRRFDTDRVSGKKVEKATARTSGRLPASRNADFEPDWPERLHPKG